MTRIERQLAAIVMAAEFIADLSSAKYTKRVPASIRKRARDILIAGFPCATASPGIRGMELEFRPVPLHERIERAKSKN